MLLGFYLGNTVGFCVIKCARRAGKAEARGPFLQWCNFLPLQLLEEQQQREEAERKQAEEEKKSLSKPDEEAYEDDDKAEETDDGVRYSQDGLPVKGASGNSPSTSTHNKAAAAAAVDSPNPRLKRHGGVSSGRNSFRSSSNRRGR